MEAELASLRAQLGTLTLENQQLKQRLAQAAPEAARPEPTKLSSAVRAVAAANRLSRAHGDRSSSMSRRPSISVVSQAASASLDIGTLAKIGEGTSGQAFLVANEWDGREYCLKIVPLHDARGRAEAANEARLHAPITHPACVRYCYSWLGSSSSDGGGEAGTCCVLMELCERDLWSCLETSAPSGEDRSGEASEPFRAVSREARLRWSADLSAALAHVHGQRIVHRDLNPWNVFVTKVSKHIHSIRWWIPLHTL